MEFDDDSRAGGGVAVNRDAIKILRWIREQRKQLAELEKTAREQLETELGENEVGTVDGKEAVTWIHYKKRVLDQRALKKVHPEIHESFLKATPSRTFHVTEEVDDDEET